MDFELLRFVGDIVKVRAAESALAHRAVVMSCEPHGDAPFAKLVAADCQDADGEWALADNTHSFLLRGSICFLEVKYCMRCQSILFHTAPMFRDGHNLR